MDDTTRGLRDESTRNYASGETSERVTGASGTTRSRTTRAAKTTATTAADLDPETEQRTRQIQADIQHTREEMAETVEALQERLRPSNVIAGATEQVRTAASEKVKSMAETASETAQDMVRETRHRAYDMIEGARQNPIPALMIGAGVAWLLMDRNKTNSRNRSYDSQSLSSKGYDAYDNEPTYSDVEYSQASGRRDDATLTRRARSAADEGIASARRTTYRAQNQLQRIMRENPLLVGAAAVVVGAAVGAALPETARENELMGEARESVINRAQDVARTAASTVQTVAKDAASEVADRVANDSVGAGTKSPRTRGTSGSSI